VIVSDNLPPDENSPGENVIVAIDASEILFGDEGIELSASKDAAVQMSTTPTHPADANTVLVSL
jgi:hypothetical protein